MKIYTKKKKVVDEFLSIERKVRSDLFSRFFFLSFLFWHLTIFGRYVFWQADRLCERLSLPIERECFRRMASRIATAERARITDCPVGFGSILSCLFFYSPLLKNLGAANDERRSAYFSGRNRRSRIADVTTKVASRHVARATYLSGRVWPCIDSPRASSEPIYRHVGYRTDDKFNPPLRTNFADLHRADPCAQIAVDLR